MITRRAFLGRTAGLAAIVLPGHQAWLHALRRGPEPVLTIYKSASCGCCTKWVDHVGANRLRTVVHDREDMDEVKDWLGVPEDLRSCHTAQVEGYLIEGHVPAVDIKRLVKQRPKIAGLAVPGMPVGSPGMEVAGRSADRYEVLAFQRDGKTEVFARY